MYFSDIEEIETIVNKVRINIVDIVSAIIIILALYFIFLI